jgi:fructose-specific component phosphotransferase system IIB-like protein
MSELQEDLTLIDEAGKARRFRVHDAIDLAGHTYYLVEAMDDASQVLILRESTGNLEAVRGKERARVLAALEADA